MLEFSDFLISVEQAYLDASQSVSPSLLNALFLLTLTPNPLLSEAPLLPMLQNTVRPPGMCSLVLLPFCFPIPVCLFFLIVYFIDLAASGLSCGTWDLSLQRVSFGTQASL